MADASDETLVEKVVRAPAFQDHLRRQLFSSLWAPTGIGKKDGIALVEAAQALVQGMKPEGAIEEMLAVQMVAIHEAAMECLRRAMIDGQTIDGRDMNLKHAAKLVALYERQIAALDRHRGKGQQSVTVKYVHVAEGGQAIVGAVSTGGSARSAKQVPNSPKGMPFETLAANSPEPVGQSIKDDTCAAVRRRGRRS